MRIPIFLLGVLVLTNCTNPTPLPAGYTYHKNLYKAPPGAEADPIGYEYSARANDQVMAIWSDVAAHLAAELESRADLPQDNLFLEPPYLKGAQVQSLDYALRRELESRGHAPGNREAASAVLTVRIMDVPMERENEDPAYTPVAASSYSGDPNDFKPRVVTAHIRGEDGSTRQVLDAIYTLPDFGYMPDYGGFRALDLNPVAGQAPSYAPPALRPPKGGATP